MTASRCNLPVLHFLLLTSANAIRLPNTTYLPASFDSSSIKTIIEGLGMIYESYLVTTGDGYMVNLNRMINPERYHSPDRGTPVLLLSGLEMHAESMFTQKVPQSNLPVAWLVAGYDIWVGDARGSVRSRGHQRLSTRDSRYWDYSFHEIGIYDLPAFIDFILTTTGRQKLVYSGFSNGGAYYYIMCSMRPEYQAKLYGGILWAPMGEMMQSSGFTWWQQFSLLGLKYTAETQMSLGFGEFPLFTNAVRFKLFLLCSIGEGLFKEYLSDTYGKGCDFGEDFCVRPSLSISGASAKTVVHTIQQFQNGGHFQQFDYGSEENYRRYGQPHPPNYDPSNIQVFTALYYSDNDMFIPASKVEPFTRRLSGLTYHCKIKGVCHAFFVWDKRMATYVEDATQVLISMTYPQLNPYKMYSGKCTIELP